MANLPSREIKFRGKSLEGWQLGQWVYGYFYIKDGRACILDEAGDVHEVDSNTVGQFTGLLDRNGKEIWEGDIWKYEDKIYEIDFCEGCFGAYKYGYFQQASIFVSGEVIGNVFENPELLKDPK